MTEKTGKRPTEIRIPKDMLRAFRIEMGEIVKGQPIHAAPPRVPIYMDVALLEEDPNED